MRILAVTADASLITAITSMMIDWEIAHVRDPDDAKPASEGATIALVDSGNTEKGIETAKSLWNNGVTLPCLVIGDAAAPPDARVRVLVRPFSLRDLTAAVDEVSAAVPMDPGVPAQTTFVEESAAVSAEAAVVTERVGEEGLAGFDEAAPPVQDAALDYVEKREEHFARPAEEPVPPILEVAPPRPQHEVAPAAAPTVETPLRPAARTEPGGLRRFLRRREEHKKTAEVPEDPTLVRLKNAIAFAHELEALVQELPVLAQPRAMAHAFLGEVVEMFGPQVAAVFAPGVDGSFGVIAAHGLSATEAGLRVSPDQPLFLEITQTLQAVLIAPVDLAQGLVAGIGGARTEALMAAPLAVGEICHAIVVVGRQDFAEFDLELLAEQAEEAAPGLAVAQMIDRLRAL